MKKYIYPAGITGHYLAWLMRFLYGDVEIEFIDDCEVATSLESFAKKNPHKDIVIEFALSKLSDNYEHKLANMKQSLERLGIAYNDRSLEWYIQQINEKVKKEFIGDEAAYMNYLDFGEVVLETSHFECDLPNKNLIYIGHGFFNNTSFIHSYKDVKATCVHDKGYIKEKREEYIPSGYLGFDVMLDKINSVGGGHSVLVAPYDIEELRLFPLIIQKILKKYKVILRQRFEWLELSEYSKYIEYIEVLKTFRGDLCMDAGESFLTSSYKESFCLICGKTTTKSTYPLLTKKPVIVLPHNRSEWVGLENDTIREN